MSMQAVLLQGAIGETGAEILNGLLEDGNFVRPLLRCDTLDYIG
jgi:hypothetical protein